MHLIYFALISCRTLSQFEYQPTLLYQYVWYTIYMHCPNHNLNLRAKTEPIPAGAVATVYVWFLGQIYCTVCKQKPDICTVYRCSCAIRDRLGFYAETVRYGSQLSFTFALHCETIPLKALLLYGDYPFKGPLTVGRLSL